MRAGWADLHLLCSLLIFFEFWSDSKRTPLCWEVDLLQRSSAVESLTRGSIETRGKRDFNEAVIRPCTDSRNYMTLTPACSASGCIDLESHIIDEQLGIEQGTNEGKSRSGARICNQQQQTKHILSNSPRLVRLRNIHSIIAGTHRLYLVLYP
jgi:hypothetical protein